MRLEFEVRRKWRGGPVRAEPEPEFLAFSSELQLSDSSPRSAAFHFFRGWGGGGGGYHPPPPPNGRGGGVTTSLLCNCFFSPFSINNIDKVTK